MAAQTARVATKVPRKKSPFPSQVVDSCAYTVGAEAANIITVTGQLKGPNGANLAVRAVIDVYISGVNTGAAIIGTAPSGGIAAGAQGAVLAAVVAGKYLKVVTDATGKFAIAITEVGVFTFYVVTVMPDGTISVSPAATFA